ncbi:MAG: hypothetical protein BWY96_02530 [Spirochaetes bacterium ADurb.BinA120]|nr:MAG: hypothetical protein BWY96_02530 [Spirochaetes bacterium ADurb.BinA120]
MSEFGRSMSRRPSNRNSLKRRFPECRPSKKCPKLKLNLRWMISSSAKGRRSTTIDASAMFQNWVSFFTSTEPAADSSIELSKTKAFSVP